MKKARNKIFGLYLFAGAVFGFALSSLSFAEEITAVAPAAERIPRRDPGEGDPIEINDIEELQAIGNDEGYPLNGVYILANDIDASETRDWNDGAGFEPIGDEEHPFTGRFDGNGRIIRGLFINRPQEDSIGLFGFTNDGAVIENVGLADVDIRGGDFVGGLAGGNYHCAISSSYVTGRVSGEGEVGGLAGNNSEESPISNCYAAAAVSGTEYIGGLLGSNYGSDISHCYASGNVSSAVGGSYVGGLLGDSWRSAISNSYATGNVHGENRIGGLIGDNYHSIVSNSSATGDVNGHYHIGGLVGCAEASPVSNSFATGSVSGNYQVGGLVGCNYLDSNISDSYATGYISGNNEVGGLVGHNEESGISRSYGTGRTEAGGENAGGLVGYNSSNSTISDCYATGSVSGIYDVGGLVGDNHRSCGISGCYAVGRVRSDDSEDVGGLVGHSEAPAENYRNNYWDTETTGQEYGLQKGNRQNIDGISGRATAEMMDEDTFEGWDFDEVWFMPGAEERELSFPHLRMEESVHRHRFGAQDIALARGWNIVSLNVIPDIKDMGFIFQDVEGVILIKDEDGHFLSRGLNFSNLEDFSFEEGYQVKVGNNADLHIYGKIVPLPAVMHLSRGWNIMGYPCAAEQAVRDVIRGLEGIELIKDERGRFVYPARNYYGFDAFQPGRGYQIKVAQETNLIIEAAD